MRVTKIELRRKQYAKIRRFIITILAVSLCAVCMAFPVMGAEVDYTAIISNAQTDGENKIVTLRYPAENTNWFLAGNETYSHTGSSVTVTFPDTEDDPWTAIWITLSPREGDRLSVFGLANNTPLLVEMDINGYILYGGAWEYFIRYYDVDGNFIRMDRNQAHYTEDQDYTNLMLSERLSIPYNAASFEFGFVYVGGENEIDTGTASMSIASLNVSVTVPADDYESGILGSIVSGTPGQNQAAGDLADKEQDVADRVDEVVDAMDSLNKPNVNVNMNVSALVSPQYNNLLVGVMRNIAGTAVITRLLTSVLTLMLAAYILFGKR